MCGRFACAVPLDLLARLFSIRTPLPDVPARYNLAPTQDILTVRFNPRDGLRSLSPLRWGLVPHWARDPSVGVKLVNARAEGIDAKPSFRDAFQKRRCLIPASAFYEWKAGPGGKRPHAVLMRDRQPFAFAGLWEGWKGPDGQWLKTVTIITTAANDLLAGLHDRMPVILPADVWPRWLGEAAATPGALLDLLRPYPAQLMQIYPVGSAVGDVRADGPHLLDPVAEEADAPPRQQALF